MSISPDSQPNQRPAHLGDIKKPSAHPSEAPDLLTEREERRFGKAARLSELDPSAVAHYQLERHLEYTYEHLNTVRGERDEYEDECLRLRDQTIGRWFQFIGGVCLALGGLLAGGAVLSDRPGSDMMGWGIFLCGALVHASGLVVPYGVSWARHRRNAQSNATKHREKHVQPLTQMRRTQRSQ